MNEIAGPQHESASFDRLAKFSLSLIVLLFVASTFMPAGGNGRGESHLGVGFLLGAIYCQVAAANAWITMGTGKSGQRLLIGLVWLASCPFATTLNLSMAGLPNAGELFLFISIGIVGQAILLQVALCILRFGFRWRIVERTQADMSGADEKLQFRLAHLIYFTTAIAILLGIGRQIVEHASITWTRRGGPEFGPFLFLAVCAALQTMPLFFSILVPGRRFWFTVPAMCILIALGTAYELPLAQLVGIRGGPDQWHFIWINLFSSLGILLFGTITRISNYRLATP